MYVRPRFLMTALCSLALGGCAGCEGEETSQPEEPRVRKLYAPGYQPNAERAEEPADAPAPTPEADAEAAALRAMLTGEGRETEEDEATEDEAERSTPDIDERRRRRRRNRRADDELVEEAPAGPNTLSDGAFQSAITDWSGMKRCLASSAGRLPTRNGALQVRFTIRGDGQVVKSSVVQTSNDVARAIAPCVERRARRIRFPAFAEAAEEVEKTAKFVF